ncbi:hypothetical protein BGY98DRAFT_963057 [Russula aff. rugulosa BPL654]|nr:hypothetical protein BGY98DRAFT_963057 [Russula aff. rugulosa BPL654]
MYDPHTHESRGFGFMAMGSVEEGDVPVTALNAAELMGKSHHCRKGSSCPYPTLGRYYEPPKHNDFE